MLLVVCLSLALYDMIVFKDALKWKSKCKSKPKAIVCYTVVKCTVLYTVVNAMVLATFWSIITYQVLLSTCSSKSAARSRRYLATELSLRSFFRVFTMKALSLRDPDTHIIASVFLPAPGHLPPLLLVFLLTCIKF